MDVSVVGGGVIGLCVAHALVKRGMNVTIIDRGAVGSGCSHGNAGHIVAGHARPLAAPGLMSSAVKWVVRRDSPFHIAPQRLITDTGWLFKFWRKCNPEDFDRGARALLEFNANSIRDFDALAEDGVEFEMHNDGLMLAYDSEEAMEHAMATFVKYPQTGYNTPRVLRGAEIREMEPSLTGDVPVALFVPEDRHVWPETLVSGLLARVQELGATVVEGTAVTGFDVGNRSVSAVRTVEGSIRSDAVVVAAGVWSRSVTDMLRCPMPIQPGKGYSITVPATRSLLRHPIHLGSSKVVCTPFSGGVRVAGTLDLAGYNAQVDRRRLESIWSTAERYLGWSRSSHIEGWSGLRPLTPDGLPVMGRLPGYTNAFVATGHGMAGVTMAPSTGRAIAGLMCDGRDTMIEPFSPDRFF